MHRRLCSPNRPPRRSKIIQCAYEVKFVQGLPQPAHLLQGAAPAKRRPLFTSPLYASRAELRGWLAAFVEECGPIFLSEDTFVEYCTHAARAKLARDSEAAPSCTGDRRLDRETVAALEMCELSRCPLAAAFAAAAVCPSAMAVSLVSCFAPVLTVSLLF